MSSLSLLSAGWLTQVATALSDVQPKFPTRSKTLSIDSDILPHCFVTSYSFVANQRHPTKMMDGSKWRDLVYLLSTTIHKKGH